MSQLFTTVVSIETLPQCIILVEPLNQLFCHKISNAVYYAYIVLSYNVSDLKDVVVYLIVG